MKKMHKKFVYTEEMLTFVPFNYKPKQ